MKFFDVGTINQRINVRHDRQISHLFVATTRPQPNGFGVAKALTHRFYNAKDLGLIFGLERIPTQEAQPFDKEFFERREDRL